MGIENRIWHERKVVITTFRGAISGDEVLCYQKSIWGGPAMAGYDVLLDFSPAARTEVSAEAIRELALRSHAIDGSVPSRMALVVADNPVDVAGAHLYKAIRESCPSCSRMVRVFHNRAEAESWLGLPVDVRKPKGTDLR